MSRSLLLAALALSALAPVAARAEQFVRAAGVEIHYNAFHADAVPAEVAAAHGIVRSGNRGLLNVTVLTPVEDGVGRPTEASVTGTVSNLAGQRQSLTFRPVREATALYYLADFPISGEDVYRFALEVSPPGASAPVTIRFQQALVGR
jgi:hypothetical protein